MSWDGYFRYGNVEIINATRTDAYVKALGLYWVKETGTAPDLPGLLGQPPYISPSVDSAPWYDSDQPDSGDFAGLIPLSVNGVEDSTRSADVFEYTVDGGSVKRLRHETKEMVFSVALIGASECAVEYGFRWLKRALLQRNCAPGTSEACGGEDLVFSRCLPTSGRGSTAGSVLDGDEAGTPVWDMDVDGGDAGTFVPDFYDGNGAQGSSRNPTWELDYRRYLRDVTIVRGPIITGKRRLTGCGGAVWTVTFTAVAGDPFEYGPDVDVFSDLGSIGGPNYLLGSDYRWTGVPHASTSEKLVDGELVATNLALNPSFEATSGTVEVRRNLFPRPVPQVTSGGSWSSNDPTRFPTTIDTSFLTPNGNQSVRADRTSDTPDNYLSWVYGVGATAYNNAGSAVVEEGQIYTVSISRAASVANSRGFISVSWWDSSGAQIGSTDSGVSEDLVTPFEWVRASRTVTAPAGAVRMRAASIIRGPSGYVSSGGEQAWSGDALLVAGAYNPEYFDGFYSPDSDLTPEWTGAANASESRLMGSAVQSVTATPGTGAVGVQSAHWLESGSKSLRIIPTIAGTTQSHVQLAHQALPRGLEAGHTYTISATFYQVAPTAPVGNARSIRFASSADGNTLTQAPNVAGASRISHTFTVPSSGTWSLRLYNGGQAGDPDVWWDDIIITEGSEVVPYFDGYTRGSFDPVTYEWTGAANNSTSTKTVKGQVVGSNLIVNPKLESNTTNYHLNGGTLSHPDGTYTRVTASNAAGPTVVNLSMHQLRPPVIPGRSYVHSADVRSYKKTGLYTIWYDANDVIIGTAAIAAVDGTGEWQRIVRSVVAPGGAATARLMMTNAETFAGGDVMDWRHARFAPASDPDPETYFDGDTPDDTAPSGADQFTAEICPAPIYTPIYDPDCPALVAPPLPPALKIGCMAEMEGLWDRDYALIPASLIPLWDEARLTFRITNHDQNNPVRNLRVGVYDNGFEADQDCAHRVGEYRISYIPAGSVLTIDAVLGSAYITDALGYARRADSLILGGPNEPPRWFGLSCGEGYYVTLDHDADDSPDISLSLSLAGRSA